MHLRNICCGALCVATAILFSGCIDVEQSLVLNPDASGTLEVRYEISEETILRVQNMLKLSDDLAESAGKTPRKSPADIFLDIIFDPTEKNIRAKLNTYSPLGIDIEAFEFKTENAKRIATFVLNFANIADVAKADFFHVYGFSCTRNSKGQYVIYNRPVTREKVAYAWDFSDPEVAKKLSPFLNGFSFIIKLQVPGQVLKTNAHQNRGGKLQWKYSFESDPYALHKMQRDQISIVFESEELNLPEIVQPPPPASEE